MSSDPQGPVQTAWNGGLRGHGSRSLRKLTLGPPLQYPTAPKARGVEGGPWEAGIYSFYHSFLLQFLGTTYLLTHTRQALYHPAASRSSLYY